MNQLQNKDNVLSFLNSEIKIVNNLEEALKEFEKIISFFEKINFYPDIDFCINIINQSPLLERLLYILKDKNKSLDSEIFMTFMASFNTIKDTNHNSIYDLNLDVEDQNFEKYDGMKLYLKDLKKKKLLSLEEEKEIGERILKGDKVALNILIESNLRLVVGIAKKYVNSGFPILDIIQEGNMGLMRAAEKFDVTKGYRFSTYATGWIEQAIRRAIDNKIRNIRIPVYISEKLKKYSKLKQLGLTDEKIMQELKITIDGLDELKRIEYDAISMNTLISDDEDTELGDFVPSPDPDIETVAIEKQMSLHILDVFSKCGLSNEEIEILILRYGFDGQGERTLQEIGDKFGITRERVNQKINRMFKRIRNSKYARELAMLLDNPDEIIKNLNENKKIINKDKEYYRMKRKLMEEEKMKLKTIFEALPGCSKEEIKWALTTLTEEEKNIFDLRNGDDLENPKHKEGWNNQLHGKKYTDIAPKLEARIKNRRVQNLDEKGLDNKKLSQNMVVKQNQKLTKEDYLELRKIMQSPLFYEIIQSLSPLEATICNLLMGVNDKTFDIQTIANFLGMNTSDCLKIVKNALINYKVNSVQKIDNFIDKISKK